MPTKERSRLEEALEIRDTITASKDTRRLIQDLFGVLETQAAIVMTMMADATKYVEISEGGSVMSKSVPFEEGDFWKHVGMVEGLKWLETEVKDLLEIANESDRQPKVKTKGE